MFYRVWKRLRIHKFGVFFEDHLWLGSRISSSRLDFSLCITHPGVFFLGSSTPFQFLFVFRCSIQVKPDPIKTLFSVLKNCIFAIFLYFLALWFCFFPSHQSHHTVLISFPHLYTVLLIHNSWLLWHSFIYSFFQWISSSVCHLQNDWTPEYKRRKPIY